MESRKIQLVGNRSYAVSLPKMWIRMNNLKEKDLILIEELKNQELLLKVATDDNKKDTQIVIETEKINDLKEFLVFCYFKSINCIVLRVNGDAEKVKNTVKEILPYLEGYEVTNELKNIIEISFLFKEVHVDIDKITKRVIYLIQSMIESIEKKRFKDIPALEQKVNSLYYLSKRLLFATVNDLKLQEINEINCPEDIFFNLEIVKRFERIADIVSSQVNQEYTKEEIKMLEKVFNIVCDDLHSKKKSKFSFNEINQIMEDFNEKQLNSIKFILSDVYRSLRYIDMNRRLFSKK